MTYLLLAVIPDLIRDPGNLCHQRPWIPDRTSLVRNDELILKLKNKVGHRSEVYRK